MIARRIALYLAFVAGFVCAQSDDKPEIRGTVTDPSLNIGVAGAEITLFEFLLDADKTVVRTQIATTSTDKRGEFRFPLDHFAEYLIEVTKEGYSVPSVGSGDAFARADVNRDHPTQDLRFLLTHPGEITGRVVDEDGNPVAGLQVATLMNATQMPSRFGPDIVTAQDGSFAVTKLPAGQYSILISPKTLENVTAQFSDEDLKIVDQDLDSASNAPVPVSSGATSSVGTITARKAPYYRAHVFVAGVDCTPKESWTFSLRYRTNPEFGRQLSIPCGSGFLVRNLKPGSYWFILRTGKPQETGKWALAEVDITRENVEVSMVMSQTADVHGRFVAVEGATLPKFQRVGIMMRGRLGALFVDSAVGAVDAEAKFTVKNLWGIPHDVSVQGLGGGYYVKEIRYNGVAMADGMVTPVPGAPAQNLEIVLDDQPATITGSVRDGDKPVSSPFIVAVKWPFTEGDVPVSGDGLKGDRDGRFQISGLAPGEYRLMAFNKIVRITELSSQLLNRAEKVTLERGSLKDVSLKLIDPSQ
jgi:Carboxypeptidase regulatory-like domain